MEAPYIRPTVERRLVGDDPCHSRLRAADQQKRRQVAHRQEGDGAESRQHAEYDRESPTLTVRCEQGHDEAEDEDDGSDTGGDRPGAEADVQRVLIHATP